MKEGSSDKKERNREERKTDADPKGVVQYCT